MDSLRKFVGRDKDPSGRFIQCREVESRRILPGLLLYLIESIAIYSYNLQDPNYFPVVEYFLRLIDEIARQYHKLRETWPRFREQLSYVLNNGNVFYFDQILKVKEFNEFIQDLSCWVVLSCEDSILSKVSSLCQYFGMKIYWKQVGVVVPPYQTGIGLIEYCDGFYRLYYVRKTYYGTDFLDWAGARGTGLDEQAFNGVCEQFEKKRAGGNNQYRTTTDQHSLQRSTDGNNQYRVSTDQHPLQRSTDENYKKCRTCQKAVIDSLCRSLCECKDHVERQLSE